MADNQIRTIIKSLEKLSERVIVKLTLDVTANLKETTPVDTGWARANWVPAIGRPFVADLEGLVRADLEALVGSQEASQSSALAKVAGTYRLSSGSVFVSNNVPYIMELNAGSSVKAPAAFVQRAIFKAATQDIKGLAT